MIKRVLVALSISSFVPPLLANGSSDPVTAEDVSRLEQRIDELEALIVELRSEVAATRARIAEAAPEPGAGPASESPSFGPVAPRQEPVDPSALRVYWRDQLRLETADEKFQLRFGGRIHTDFASFSVDESLEGRTGPLTDGFEFRRARLGVQGTIFGNIDYKAEYDFAGAVVDGVTEGASFKDVYVGIRNIPGLGSIRVGHQKEPFGLEELNSSRFVQFQERASASAFIPSRNTGILLANQLAGDRLYLAAGFFKSADAKGTGLGDGGYNFSTRLAATPLYRDAGRRLVHLGAAFSHQNSFRGPLRFRERPEAHLAPRFVDTGSFAARKYQLLGLEAALVAGPFAAQGEFIQNWVDAPAAGDPRFRSGYVQGSFFLTGEHRRYSRSKATFDRNRPAHNFFDGAGGIGAWEVAARYSRLDLDDSLIRGGVMDNLTLGLNWYLNPNTRWTFNYVFSDVENVAGANIFQMRFMVDF